MFRHQLCHPRGACFVTLPNYVSTIASFAKINKILKLSNTIKFNTFNNHTLLIILLINTVFVTDCIYGHHTDFL